MKLQLFQVDAFTDRVFGGNPAAVCPLEAWLPDDLMQQIAAENNLSETAFFVKRGSRFEIRWFTPTTEVELCGHATLASARVIWEHMDVSDPLIFDTRSGELRVERNGERIVLDFPRKPLEPARRSPQQLIEGLRVTPEDLRANGEDAGSGFYVACYDSEDTIRKLLPEMTALAMLGRMGVVVTAPGNTSDFASRCFAPTFGIPEDPVTGSIHCFLAPYWAERLGRTTLHARQVSRREGELFCEVRGDRVRIGGRTAGYLTGTIEVPN